MTTTVIPRPATLARNTLLNIAGGVLPPAVGLAVVPLLVRGLGTERYGLWALAWSILSYFIVFDLGLGKATTKFVAEALARGQKEDIPPIFWTAVVASLALGTLAGISFMAAVPFLTSRVLRISPGLVPEAKAFLLVFAAFAPLHLCQRAVSALLEGSHRFDLSNALGVPGRIAGMVLPLVGVWLGWPLAGIGALALAAGLGGLLATFAVALWVRPEVRSGLTFNKRALRRLLGFGGWMMGISTLALVVAGSDRVVIGAVLSASAVAYYAPPQSLIGQMYIIPSAVYATLFPAFSALEGVDKSRMERLYASAFKILALAMGPIALLLVVFARDGLTLWLGPEFAAQSTRVLQVLAVGMFLGTLGWIPSTALQGAGRPDLVAKILFVGALVFFPIMVALTPKMGILGTALAIAGREALGPTVFPLVAWKTLGLSPTLWLVTGGIGGGILLGSLTVALCLVHFLFPVSWGIQKLVVAAGLLGIFALLAWHVALNSEERRAIRDTVLGLRLKGR